MYSKVTFGLEYAAAINSSHCESHCVGPCVAVEPALIGELHEMTNQS